MQQNPHLILLHRKEQFYDVNVNFILYELVKVLPPFTAAKHLVKDS